jgi:putative ABC transport system permease protein
LTSRDVDAIERLSSVEIAIPRIIATGKIEYNDAVSFGMVASIPDGNKRKWAYEILDSEVGSGRLLKDGDVNKVILGYKFGLSNGVFEKPVVVGKTILIQDKKFIVVGILKKSGSAIFNGVIMMNDAPLRDLMNYGDDVDVVAVKVRGEDVMDRAKVDIEKLLRKLRDVEEGEEDFAVSTPEAMMETVNNVLGGVQAFIVIIASISILVGALGIVNTMTTSVLERRKEIGIMKAIGGTNFQIFMQFFFESGLLGFVGGLVGVIFGTLIGIAGIAGINGFIGADLDFVIDPILIGGALLGSFFVGSVAGIAPAMSAARQNPVEALRG